MINEELVAATGKKDNVLDRINKRNKDRQNYLDVKLEQRSKDQVQLEGADYFAQAFADRVREIETRVQNLSEQEVKRGANQTADLVRLFADTTMEIQELERYLTTSTMFLTDYKIKACQNVLHELNASCEETRLRLLPKKKFGFSGKKVAVKPALNPKLASTQLDGGDGGGKVLEKTASSGFTWTLSNRQDEYIYLSGDAVNNQDITISDVRNCFVELQGHPGSVQISNATDCIFVCGPIARSLFAEHCNQTTFAVACQQLRLHSSAHCRIYLHVTCRAIIEDCTQIGVAEYCYDYDAIEADFQRACINKAQNNYTDIADFNWLSPDVPSPNWHLLKDCALPNWCELRGKYKEKTADNVVL